MNSKGIRTALSQLNNRARCPKCKNKMFVGATARVCGHVACKECFAKSSDHCPMCNTELKPEDIHIHDQIEDILIYSMGPNRPKFGSKRSNFGMFFMVEPRILKQDHKGETQLHKECRDGTVDDVMGLVSNGINLNIQDYAGWAPLHEAVIANRNDVAKVLIESGASVNIPGLHYATALHIAVEKGNNDMVELLIKNGASVTRHNSDGKTPVDLCDPDNAILLNILCTTQRKLYLYTVFVIPKMIVVCIGVKDADHRKLSLIRGLTIVPLDAFLNNTIANYVIINSKDPNPLYLQLAIQQRAFVYTAIGFFKFIENQIQNPLDYLTESPKYAVRKAVMHKLHSEPLLFHSIYFFFHTAPIQKIQGYNYKCEDFKLLATAGGGTVLCRKPTPADESNGYYFPYHADKDSDVACTNNYIICEDAALESASLKSRTIKYRTFSWFIDCINNYYLK